MLVSRFDQTAPQLPEQDMQRRRIKFAETLSGQDDNVDIAQFDTLMSKGLTGHALDAIAINRVAYTFPGNHQSQPWMRQIVVSGQQQYAGT